MISHDLESFFELRGVRRNGALLLDEGNALALIDEAQRSQIGILGVDQCRPSSIDSYARLDRKLIDHAPLRADSWSRARQFIEDLSGRGLLFEVALEAPRFTRLHQLRDRSVPFERWSTVFQIVFLVYVALLIAVVLRVAG